jgi:hypothetical protein
MYTIVIVSLVIHKSDEEWCMFVRVARFSSGVLVFESRQHSVLFRCYRGNFLRISLAQGPRGSVLR